MRQSFAAANPAHAVGELTQGITDLPESGEPARVYRALAGLDELNNVPPHAHGAFLLPIRKIQLVQPNGVRLLIFVAVLLIVDCHAIPVVPIARVLIMIER